MKRPVITRRTKILWTINLVLTAILALLEWHRPWLTNGWWSR